MIINLRGTSGSGKSTIVKEVMALYPIKIPLVEPKRKQPVGYELAGRGKPLFVPGHYATACGGCDRIKTLDQVYQLIRDHANRGFDVLYEGIMASGESARAKELWNSHFDLHVIALDVPIDECIRSIQARREAKTPGAEKVNPERTIRRAREVRSMMEHLKVYGVPTSWHDRVGAKQWIVELLQL